MGIFENMSSLVLVTGGTGFIASHICKQLGMKGIKMRVTVRNKTSFKTEALKEVLKEYESLIEFYELDLTSSDKTVWDEAVKGITHVLHTASPFIVNVKQKDEYNKLLKPAIEGTRSILEACHRNRESIKRIVVTASVASVICGHDSYESPMTHLSYSVPEKINTYSLSKTLAELEAWRVADHNNLPLCTIHPGLVIGPMLLKEHYSGESSNSMKAITNFPRILANVSMPVVDVRDVAWMHIKAVFLDNIIESPRPRFLCTASNGKDTTLPSFAKMCKSSMENTDSEHIKFASVCAYSSLVRAISTMADVVPLEYLDLKVKVDDVLARETLDFKELGSCEWAAYGYFMSAMKLGLINPGNCKVYESFDPYQKFENKLWKDKHNYSIVNRSN